MLLTLFPFQASPAPFPGAGEASAFAAAMVWGIATVWFTFAFRRGRALDAVLVKNGSGALALGLLALLVPVSYGGGAADPGSIGWLLLSGMIGLGVGDWLYFVALSHIGVGRTLVLGQSLPVLNALLAWGTHGEFLSSLQWVGVLAIVGGGLLAESRRVRRGQTDAIGVAAALGAVLMFAIGNVMMAEGVRQTQPIPGAAWRLLGGVLGLLLLRTLSGRLRETLVPLGKAEPWKLFLLPSALGTWLGMTLLTGGFKWAKQGVAAALAGSTPLISVPLAVWVLHERPGWRGWGGVLLVVLGGVLLALASPAAVDAGVS